MRRYALRDDQWDRIKNLLPGREGYVGATAKDNRRFVEAVLYRYRAGIPCGTCRSALAIRSRFIRASPAGPRAGYGRGCLRPWRPMRTMNTP
jgi:transposase